ncbi:MAG: hypothetical protein CFH38_01020 [Alphaproteobacteria bacterium MarineAlpha10_Bin1]|jgi:hypothetical protein|nr:MAG: hypothetical protein CFH38_01020 [Alphaproteobacteria bacterium MarineAlpha10_Bin1]
MSLIARVLVVAALAVFAINTVTDTAMAASMSVKVVDCEGCNSGGDDNNSGSACDKICVTAFGAFVAEAGEFQPREAVTILAFGTHIMSDRIWPPDPFPFRSPALG